MFSSLSSMGQRLAADHKKDRQEQYSLISCPDSNHPHMIDLGLPSGTRPGFAFRHAVAVLQRRGIEA